MQAVKKTISGLYRTPDAAKYLNVSVSKLLQDRKNKIGPRYIKIGKIIRYRLCDLDQYIEQHCVAHLNECK